MQETSAVLPPASGGVKAYSRAVLSLASFSLGALLSCVYAPESLDDRELDRLEIGLVHPADGAEIDPGSPLVARLDGPWDPWRSDPDALLTVTSGSVQMFGRVETSLTDLEVRFVPIEPWSDRLTWTIEWSASALRGTDGRSAVVPPPTTFRVTPGPGEPLPDPPVPLSFATDIAPILADCATCHDGAGQVALTADALVGERSWTHPDRWLVLAGEPARSVLLNKLVDAPVDRTGTAMPPPWSDQSALAPSEVRRVEQWIATGARP